MGEKTIRYIDGPLGGWFTPCPTGVTEGQRFFITKDDGPEPVLHEYELGPERDGWLTAKYIEPGETAA